VSAIASLAPCAEVRAQTFDVVYAFTVPPASPRAGFVQGADGKFYGTTRYGGGKSAGAVIRVDSLGNLSVLHVFNVYDGSVPAGGVVQALDAAFYGTTSYGGVGGFGTAYKVDAAGTFTFLHSFTGSDGSAPGSELLQAPGGAFYGTTSTGGLNDLGTVFKMDTAGNVTTLHSFNGTDGDYPSAGLVLASDGKLYGTTHGGGTIGVGTVFRIDTAGTNFVTLRNFAGSNGSGPAARLLQASDGMFYGTTQGGGANALGTVFKMDAAGNVTTLRSFAGGSEGSGPVAALVQGTDGKLYGTTPGGGTSSLGTAFRIDTAGTNFATLHPFAGSDGSFPVANVIQATDGKFYGTTSGGGANGDDWGGGTAFVMTPAGALTTLVSLGAPSTGYEPSAPVVQASDGNLYGTTYRGGPSNSGTVFKLTTAGARTVLHEFSGADGTNPYAKLLQASDTKLYGTTNSGGTSDSGTAFRVDGAGAFASLHSFDGTDGLGSSAALIQATDGNLYGMMYDEGGADMKGFGTAFRMTTAGSVTTLHVFTIPDGAYPGAALVQSTADSLFYGTTESGGANLQGNVLKMTSTGTVTALHAFNHVAGSDDDGSFPHGGLIRATDGKFYGTTRQGGAHEGGTVFRVDSAGSYATLYSFAGADGLEPYGNLVQASDGKFYGATYAGGASGRGTVFRIDTAGTLTTLHGFTGGDDGEGPVGGLMQASDGKLYGVANQGGSGAAGVVYRVTLCSPPPAPTAGNDGPRCAGATLHLTASTVAGATYAWTGPNGFASSAQNPSIANVTAAAAGTYSVTATVAGCTSPAGTTTVTVNAPPSSTITAPASVCASATGQTASVPDAGPGATYAWTITTGTITAGAGTRTITFTAGASGSVALGATVTSAAGCASSSAKAVPITTCAAARLFPLTPCRLVDTRNAAGPRGGPAIAAGGTRTFPLAGTCGVPSGTVALSLNVTVTGSTAGGDLKLYAAGTATPVATTINYSTGQTRANNAIAAPDASGNLTVRCDQASGTAHVVLDVNGYFK
jgi:uncharacterized repeat protein (TIGR03803 family)